MKPNPQLIEELLRNLDRLDPDAKAAIEKASNPEAVLMDKIQEIASLISPLKIFIRPPKRLSFIIPRKEKLIPEEITVSLHKEDYFRFATFWFRFPYDRVLIDGPEYEPVTFVFLDNKLIELQVRSHWRIIHIRSNAVLRDGAIYLTFTDSGHTPIPIVITNCCNKNCFGFVSRDERDIGKQILIETKGDILDYLCLRWFREYVLSFCKKFEKIKNEFMPLHMLGSKLLWRALPAKIKRNPIKSDWYTKPIFI